MMAKTCYSPIPKFISFRVIYSLLPFSLKQRRWKIHLKVQEMSRDYQGNRADPLPVLPRMLLARCMDSPRDFLKTTRDEMAGTVKSNFIYLDFQVSKHRWLFSAISAVLLSAGLSFVFFFALFAFVLPFLCRSSSCYCLCSGYLYPISTTIRVLKCIKT